MNPPYTLDRTVIFFRRLGSRQTMMILYLLENQGSVIMGDLATATNIPHARMVNLCVELEDLGILRKTYLDKGPGRGLASIQIEPNVSNLMRPYLKPISEDPETIEVVKRYQEMKDDKQLLTDKYQ